MKRTESHSTRVLGVVAVLGMLCLFLPACKSSGSSSGTAGAGSTDNSTASTANLSWSAPSRNEDGTTLNDLSGYNVYYGTQSGTYTHVLDVGDTTEVEITDLTPDTYFFVVSAYDENGNEGDVSNEVQKPVQ